MSDSSTSNSSDRRTLGLFLGKVCAFVTIFGLTALGGTLVFDHVVNWRSRQNPNQRLLWDDRTDQADVIFLGDSVFVSDFIDSPKEGFASLVSELTGRRTFNGSLDGADPPDFLHASELLVANGTRNATVILDAMPDRFLSFRHPELADGNYPDRFERLVGHDPASRFIVAVRKRLLILDPDIVWSCMFPKKFYGVEPYHDRVWNRDGNLARSRFQVFERQVQGRKTGSFDWIEQMQTILRRGDNRLVIFVSPVNTALVDAYAPPEKAQEYRELFHVAHSDLLKYLQQKGIPYIDANGYVDSDSFVDLVHVNARGNRAFADLISRYLHPNPVEAPTLTKVDENSGPSGPDHQLADKFAKRKR